MLNDRRYVDFYELFMGSLSFKNFGIFSVILTAFFGYSLGFLRSFLVFHSYDFLLVGYYSNICYLFLSKDQTSRITYFLTSPPAYPPSACIGVSFFGCHQPNYPCPVP